MVAALRRSGRHVRKRTLSLWTAKGYLPPLTKHGRGPGAGWINEWHHDGIVGQAIFVYDLLHTHQLGESHILGVFYAGYLVDPVRVRSALIRRLNQIDSSVERQFNSVSAVREDAVAVWVERQSKKWTKTHGDSKVVKEAISHFGNLMFDASSAWDFDEVERIADAVIEIFSTLGRGRRIKSAVKRIAMERLAKFLEATISLKSMRQIIELASPEELIKAQGEWQRVVHIVNKAAPTYVASFPMAPISREQLFAIKYGKFAISMLIYLARVRSKPSIERSLDILEKLRYLADFVPVSRRILRGDHIHSRVKYEYAAALRAFAKAWGYTSIGALLTGGQGVLNIG